MKYIKEYETHLGKKTLSKYVKDYIIHINYGLVIIIFFINTMETCSKSYTF